MMGKKWLLKIVSQVEFTSLTFSPATAHVRGPDGQRDDAPGGPSSHGVHKWVVSKMDGL